MDEPGKQGLSLLQHGERLRVNLGSDFADSQFLLSLLIGTVCFRIILFSMIGVPNDRGCVLIRSQLLCYFLHCAEIELSLLAWHRARQRAGRRDGRRLRNRLSLLRRWLKML